MGSGGRRAEWSEEGAKQGIEGGIRGVGRLWEEQRFTDGPRWISLPAAATMPHFCIQTCAGELASTGPRRLMVDWESLQSSFPTEASCPCSIPPIMDVAFIYLELLHW